MNENGECETQNQQIQESKGYEQCREERIKENMERMQKLGIFDLSLKVKSLKSTPKHSPSSSSRKTPQSISPLRRSEPIRRSSRLQNATPISYSEVAKAKEESSLEDDYLISEGSKAENYTEKHEKMLGNTERSWTFFVDGYGKDGRRIYDPVNGKTCHQCRQKTLGHRTHCSRCNMVQGQFCGDCLYMRYGEHVLEAKEDPNWICPVCRGICNCSLCRNAKGWAPTGCLYKKISKLGYKSVAHYLIETQRPETESSKNSGSKIPTSAKRSLPFTDTEMPDVKEEAYPSTDEQQMPENLSDKMDGVVQMEKTNNGNINVLTESNPPTPTKMTKAATEAGNCQILLPIINSVEVKDDEGNVAPETKLNLNKETIGIGIGVVDEETSEAKTSCSIMTTREMIAMKVENSDTMLNVYCELSENKAETKLGSSVVFTSPTVADSIGARLRLRRGRSSNQGSPCVF